MKDIIFYTTIFSFIVGFVSLCLWKNRNCQPPTIIYDKNGRKKVEPYLRGVPYQSTGIVGNGFSNKLRIKKDNGGMIWFFWHSFK
jgi:hypothetical protein